MKYGLTNRAGRFLGGFHPNGGFEIKDVFPCCTSGAFISFDTIQEASIFVWRMEKICIEQKDRWKDWLPKAMKFIKTLRITILSNNL